jgi:hypothetical protein
VLAAWSFVSHTMAFSLPNFQKFDPSPDAGDVVVRWNKWINRFRNMLAALAIDNDEQRKALFLHYIGEETYDIYETLTLPIAGEGEMQTDVAIRALTVHFSPRRNREFEVYKFRQLKQDKGEEVIAFVTRLRHMATTCEFHDVDVEIKSQLIQGCQSNRLRRKALSDPTMTLNNMIEFARAAEMAELQATGIERDSAAGLQSVNQVRTDMRRSANYKAEQKHKPCDKNTNGVKSETQCRNCGKQWPHRDKCPALGKSCNKCRKANHFAAV